jgi:hypothetical protein
MSETEIRSWHEIYMNACYSPALYNTLVQVKVHRRSFASSLREGRRKQNMLTCLGGRDYTKLNIHDQGEICLDVNAAPFYIYIL